jgi:hypothetical protein
MKCNSSLYHLLYTSDDFSESAISLAYHSKSTTVRKGAKAFLLKIKPRYTTALSTRYYDNLSALLRDANSLGDCVIYR